MMSNSYLARVTDLGNQMVFIESVGDAAIKLLKKHSLKWMLTAQDKAIKTMIMQMETGNLSCEEYCIAIASAHDIKGRELADIIHPNYDWPQVRDEGKVPVARSIFKKAWLANWLYLFDRAAANKLSSCTELSVVVVDADVAEIFLVGAQ